MKNPLFYAKILLFGEYGIIQDGKGLTIPYNFYKGAFEFEESQNARQSNESLRKYALYLQENFSHVLDIATLEKDLQKGMHFDSDIPQGYGVGSSGALVAALYERYAKEKIEAGNLNSKNILVLKKTLGEMESYFHGKSSGLDPLICYLNLPILIRSKDDIRTIGIPEATAGKGAIFLINSGQPGETAPMVEIFFEKLKQEGFRKTLKEEFIRYNNACVDSFVKGEFKPLFSHLRKLSIWALEHFSPMIPLQLRKLWETGIQTQSYYLKLCGSGGGGYVLGFAPDYEVASKHLASWKPEVIYTF